MTKNMLKYLVSCTLLTAVTMLATGCSDDNIISNENNGSNGLHIRFNIQDATRIADKELNSGKVSSNKYLQMQGLNSSDLTVRTFKAQCSDGRTMNLVEETTPGLPSVLEDTPITRGQHVYLVSNDKLSNQFKATAFFGTSSNSLKIDDKFKNIIFEGAGHTNQGSFNWDINKPYGQFYAYGPNFPYYDIDLKEDQGKKTIPFEVLYDVSRQIDLVTATSNIVGLSDADKTARKCPHINLTFRHPLTALRFKIGKDILGAGKNIESITIENVKYKGTYILPDNNEGFGKWETSSSIKQFTLENSGYTKFQNAENNTCLVAGTGKYAKNNYTTMFMIPQNTENVIIKVSGGGKTISARVDVKWKPGTTKTYAFYPKADKNSYHLTVHGGKELNYNIQSSKLIATEEVPFTVTSYKAGNRPQPWIVDGYDISNDGGKTYKHVSSEDAYNIIELSKGFGNGSIATNGEEVKATVHWDVVDEVANINKQLNDNLSVGIGAPYNLATNKEGYEIYNNKNANTANCYIVSAPGRYAIPLVYGNAVKGGAVNAKAYDTTRKCYKDYLGGEIARPSIEGVKTADIIWQDGGQIDRSDVKIENDNLVFKVNYGRMKNGNAVVAVKDAQGRIMWSWHLWFTPKDVLQTTKLKGETSLGEKLQMNALAKKPLGFAYIKWLQSKNTDGTNRTEARHIKINIKQNAPNGQKATVEIIQNPVYCKEINTTSYQYGRKDPMPNKNVDGFNIQPAATNGTTLQELIKHPGTFYTGKKLYSEFDNGETYSLWASNMTLDSHDKVNTEKSIYDPCPAGYKVMPVAYIPIFTNNALYTRGSWDVGRWIKTNTTEKYYLLYAANGRTYGTGAVETPGKLGLYWASCAATKANLSGFIFSPSSPDGKNKNIASVFGQFFQFNNSCGILPVEDK